jgi:O-antigen ligase
MLNENKNTIFKSRNYVILVLFIIVFNSLLTVGYFGATYNSIKFYTFFLFFSPIYFLRTLQRPLLISRYFLSTILIFFIHFLICILGFTSGYSVKDFFILLCLACLFTFLSNELITFPKAKKRYLQFLLILGSLAVLVGGIEYLISFFSGIRQEGIPLLIPIGRIGRIAGFFGQANHFGLILEIYLLTLTGFAVIYESFEKKNRLSYLLCICLISGAAILYLTGSRCSILGLLLSFFLFSFKCHTFKGRFSFKFSLFLVGVGLFVGVFLHYLIPSGSADFAQRVIDPVKGYSIYQRFIFWFSSLFIFFDHFLFGVGFNQFANLLPSYALKAHEFLSFVPFESISHTSWSHNEILQIICEMGMLGVLLLCIFSFWFLRLYCKFLKSDSMEFSISFLLIIPFIVHSFFSWNIRFLPLVFIFIFVVCLMPKISPEQKNLIIPKFIGICVSLLLLVGVYSGFSKEIFLKEIKNKVVFGSDEEGVASLEMASKDWYARPVAFEQGLPILIDNVVDKNDFLLARRLLPLIKYQVGIRGTYFEWYGLGKIYLILNEYNAARNAFSQAVQLQPVFSRGWEALHHSNILLASKKTGRPISDFIPVEVPPLNELFSEDFTHSR